MPEPLRKPGQDLGIFGVPKSEPLTEAEHDTE